MKNYLKKYLPLFGIILSAGFIILGISFYREIKTYQTEYAEYYKKKAGTFRLSDDYDSKTSSFSEFLNSDHALETEENAYRMIKDGTIDYYEIYSNPLYFVGNYSSAVKDGVDHLMLNEENSGEKLTDFTGIALDQKSYAQYGFAHQIRSGKGFYAKDFAVTSKARIPVLLGSQLKDSFQIGQSFSGKFVLDRNLTFYVAGFLNKGREAMVDDRKVSLDDKILLPSIKPDAGDTDAEKIILYSMKLEGNVAYSTNENYVESAGYIRKIRKKTGYRYSKIKTVQDIETPQFSSKRIPGLFLAAGISMLVLTWIGSVHSLRKEEDRS